MKKLFKLYREKVLATPNLKRASQINFILCVLCLIATLGMWPSVAAGNILTILLSLFTAIISLDGLLSWYIQRKELKLREKAKK